MNLDPISEDGKAIFTSVACLYVRASEWKKSAALSRVTVYELPNAAVPYRLVFVSAANGAVQINVQITPELRAKRARDDFLSFSVKYGCGKLMSYGVQLKARKYADQLLVALSTSATAKKKAKGGGASAFSISGPTNFQHVEHPSMPGKPGAAAASGPTPVPARGVGGNAGRGPPGAPGGGGMAPLPSGWQEAKAPDGRTYYYNMSGETTWQRPGGSPGPNAATAQRRMTQPAQHGSPMAGGGHNNMQRSVSTSSMAGAGPGGGGGGMSDMQLAQRLLDALPASLTRVSAQQVHVAAAIGKGCYGTVYEGRWHQRAVAVKQLDVSSRAAGGGDANGVEKSLKEFEVEARLMHRIPEHPNVLGILGILVNLPQLSIVMEFMELTDLYAVLTSGDPISASLEDKWIKGLAAGLRHVARTGIIHRDVAARNVLLNRDYHPKLADFGLAIAVEDNGVMEETALNKWLAPEAIRDRIYTLKSDVWSYGVTVYEILTKKIPYEGLDPMMAAMRIVGEGLNPGVPDGTSPQHAQLLRACFVTEQEQRATMDQVCQILQVNN